MAPTPTKEREMAENGDRWNGTSTESFKEAAKEAVEHYERERGKPPPGEPVTLKVVEMYVTVTNPLHDYRVVLGPGG
jgi:hypothetical protein